MKLKFIALAVCSLLCVGSAYAAVNTVANDTKYVIADETGVDISAGATISGWQSSAELKLLTISFDKNVLADFDYDAMDTETYAYILEYLCFNGKTVKEINEDTSLGALSWEYTQFPGNADDKYKVPVLVYERDAARLRLFIHENYFNALGGSVTFEMKKGLTFINEGATYTMNKTRKFVYDGSAWVAEKEEKDITANVSINGWTTAGTANELTYTCINFGEGVLPSDLGYHILDTDIGTQYHYIKDFITVNGKTVGEINEETDVSSYIFSSFPSTAADKYKLPIILFGNGGNLEVKIHNDYIATLGDNIEISVKAGLYFDGESNRYTIKNDITAMVKGTKEMDVTEGVAINGWDATGDASELTYTRINLGEGVMPDIGYGIIDNANYTYLQEYITINGVTVAEINANTDDSAYVYSTFPSTADVKYQIPVMIFVNGGTLEVKVHNDYVATLGETITIAVKSGAYVENGNAKYVVTQDVEKVVYALVVNTYTVTFMDGETVVATVPYTDGQESIEEPAVPTKDGYTGAWESYTLSGGDIVVNAVYTLVQTTDITANVMVNGWDATGDASELTYTRINLGEGVMPAIGYGIIDADAWKYIQEYITINGRTIAEINANTDDSAYVYSTFPSTADVKYQIPVMIYVNDGTLEVKVHNDYIATLGEDPEIAIGVKAGLTIAGENILYKVAEDVAVTVKEPAVIVDVTVNVVIGGWKMIGDLSELTRTTISFGEGVMPEDVDYGIMDNAKYGYMLDYFTINGKTVREINETTDVSSYVFHTFPSTASAKYQVPVVIYVNGDNVELKIHNDYLAALGGNIDVIVGVKAGLSIVNGSTTYTVSSDVTEYARRKAYTLTIEMNPGEDEQFLTVGSEIVLTAPTKEHYTFIGWFEKGTDNAVLSVMPERDYTVYAKYEAIAYTVTFMDGDTVVDTVTYTLDNTAITEPAVPTKEGFTSAWAIYELTGGNMTVKVVYTEIIEDDSSSDSSSDTSSDSSDDIIDDSSSSDDIVDDNTGSASSDDVVSGTTSDDDNSSSSGCFGTVSGAYVAVVGMLAVALLKKKENE